MSKHKVSYQFLTPQSFLERSVAAFHQKDAIVYRSSRWTYAQFAARVNQLANALKNWGLQKGDRIAFLCPNIPPMLEAHFGVPLAGGVLVAINIRLAAKDICYILNNCGARLVFVDTELSHLVASVRDELESVEEIINIVDSQIEAKGEKLPGTDYETFLTTGSSDPISSSLTDENEPISINYTSGTSGQPKGVVYTHRGAYLNALGEALELGMNNNSIYLWTLPMFHCNGWCFTWGVIAVGGTHICMRKFFPNTVVSLIMDEGVTHFCGSPTILIALANDRAIKKLQLSHPLRVATAGAPPSPTIIQTMEELGIDITHVYGLTETYGPHSVCEWQAPWDDLPMAERAKLKARQGVPYIHAAQMRVVDKDMQDVPADGETMGEVVMRGNNVMQGYFNDPEATELAFRGGWFHSGDLAVMYPDGYMELRDRAKDIIISSGTNISTIEVERVIYKHPAVLEVAVIAIPDEKRGEVPKAFVTLKPDESVTGAEIIDFCRQNLAQFKVPKAVEFIELPKTATGKVQKYLLREKEWVGYEKRIH
ncbi:MULTISPECIES: acyl--CoA ligase family protein [unclassified Okeania]|uniref:acyl--CoA ligase family protein n=1 Tax=unclassified Okeania TaxID=2634635 RepID=UPI0013BB64C4|nr:MULTISPECIES: acyl--CoA ligase family protein [unclassified Okeania]NES78420.1 long-chain-fatty-acid--CoA ligase [Okeania sp. SIO1H4]NET21720.1 long-chain-fatty-acid--CoA ligase [Okeania sp. SIO1H5]NET96043.1 long-chain-fatty-acid--CoA ligase [Okeania sp. SIO1H2]